MRLSRPLSYLAPYSHSIAQSYISILAYQPNFFRASPKTDSQSPSETCALDFNREFRRSEIFSGSSTIGTDRLILLSAATNDHPLSGRKDR